jgi:hypothetical protein
LFFCIAFFGIDQTEFVASAKRRQTEQEPDILANNNAGLRKDALLWALWPEILAFAEVVWKAEEATA